MIEEPPKLTIRKPGPRPDAALLAAFQGVPTGFVTDAMAGRGALSPAIKPLSPASIAGVALTAGNGAGDIMATLAALAYVAPGDVLVVATEAHMACAAIGDRVCGMAKNGGAVALVTDGCARDQDGIDAVGLPVWCAGITPNSPYTTGPGTVGLPVQIGGMQVDTGDVIVADRDGVVVVPKDRIAETADRLAAVRALEESLDAEVAAGLAVTDGVKNWLTDGTTVRFVD